MKNLVFIVLLSIFLASCVEEIGFDPSKDVPDTIVVSGDFTNSQGKHRVFITRPGVYGKANFEPVTDARVWIVDAASGERAEYAPVYGQAVADPEFCYQLPAGALQGVPGRSYYLEIQLSDGKLYRSVETALPEPVPCDSMDALGTTFNAGISATEGGQQRFVNVYLNTTLPNDENNHFLRWEISRVYHFQQFYGDPVPPKPQTYCFINDFFDRQNVHIQSFAKQPGFQLRRRMVQMEIDESFEVLNWFTAVQRTLSPDAYQYWESVDATANPDGTVFDPPPSPLRGNLYNVNDPSEQPLGYFEVSGVDTARLRLVTTDLGSQFAAPRYCEYKPPYYAYPGQECYCCILLPYSQYEKPWYWY